MGEYFLDAFSSLPQFYPTKGPTSPSPSPPLPCTPPPNFYPHHLRCPHPLAPNLPRIFPAVSLLRFPVSQNYSTAITIDYLTCSACKRSKPAADFSDTGY